MMTFENLNLPVVLSQPHTEQGWIRTRHARWADLVESVALMNGAVNKVIADADAFSRAVEALRPVMEAHPNWTVSETLAMVAKSDVA